MSQPESLKTIATTPWAVGWRLCFFAMVTRFFFCVCVSRPPSPRADLSLLSLACTRRPGPRCGARRQRRQHQHDARQSQGGRRAVCAVERAASAERMTCSTSIYLEGGAILSGTVDVRESILFLCDSSHICAIVCCEIHSNGLQEKAGEKSCEGSAGRKTKRNRVNRHER